VAGKTGTGGDGAVRSVAAAQEIRLTDPLTLGRAFRFPLQTARSRREILIGAAWLLVPLVGWILNMGRHGRPGMRSHFIAAGAAWMLLLGPGFARADDPKPAAPVDENLARVVELERQVKQHLTDHADDAVKKDCKGALELAGKLTDANLKTRCLNVIGMVLDTSNNDEVRKVAIKAIADSGDKSLYRFVTTYLKQPNPKVVPELIMDAIDCAGKLTADEAVQPMLDLEKNSDVYTVTVAAIKALSNYGDAKRWRAKILKDLIGDIYQDRPGIKHRDPAVSRERYEALSGEIVKTCNKLTGRTYASPEEWFDLVEKYKTDLDALFK
jgi:hypothetical protein